MPLPALAAAIIPSLIGAAGQAGASAIGGAAAGADRAKQRAMLERILSEYGDISIPELESLVGEQLGPSAQESVSTDPRLRSEQVGALESLDQYAAEGDTAGSKAAMHRILSDVARQEGAGRNAVLQNARARGVSGSGSELAAQLSNQQASADRAQSAGLNQAAESQRRMLEAQLQKGKLAGSIRSQDYGEATDAARAKDMISRYNADSRTRAQYHNAGNPERQFGMKMQLTNSKANAMNGVASNYGQSADRSAATGAGVGQAINIGANAIGAEINKPDAAKPDEDDGIPYYLRRP